MATEAMIGYQTKYRIMDTTAVPAAFFELAEVFNLTPGEASADRIDASHYQSPGRRREYISGMIDSGTASVELNWIPGNSTDAFLRDLFESGETRVHQIEFPSGVTVDFEAVITGYSKAVPLDDRMTATLEIAVSGAETWGTAA